MFNSFPSLLSCSIRSVCHHIHAPEGVEGDCPRLLEWPSSQPPSGCVSARNAGRSASQASLRGRFEADFVGYPVGFFTMAWPPPSSSSSSSSLISVLNDLPCCGSGDKAGGPFLCACACARVCLCPAIVRKSFNEVSLCDSAFSEEPDLYHLIHEALMVEQAALLQRERVDILGSKIASLQVSRNN